MKTNLKYLILGLSIMGSVTIYMFGSYMKDMRQMQWKQLQTDTKELKLTECLEEAEDNYATNWNTGCALEGREEGCKSLRIYGKQYNEGHQREIDRCIKLYK